MAFKFSSFINTPNGRLSINVENCCSVFLSVSSASTRFVISLKSSIIPSISPFCPLKATQLNIPGIILKEVKNINTYEVMDIRQCDNKDLGIY